MGFAHLHLHTQYSHLDGYGSIFYLLEKAKELGQEALAITDHGNLWGVPEFFIKCIKNNIKPIIGEEVYIVRGSRVDKETIQNSYHLVLLCENNIGFQNLLKINEIGYKEGLLYRPRVDYETLLKYHEGLICLSGCISGEIPQLLLNDEYNKALKTANDLKNIFGENNFFIELENHGIKDELKIIQQLVNLSKKIGVKIVATNDVHYIEKDNSVAQDCLTCINMCKKLNEKDRMKYESNQYYLKSEQEMREIFVDFPEAISNTSQIANRCNVSLKFDTEVYNELINNNDGWAKYRIETQSRYKNLIQEKDHNENDILKELLIHYLSYNSRIPINKLKTKINILELINLINTIRYGE